MKGPFSGKDWRLLVGCDSLKLPEFQIILLASAEAAPLALLLGLVLPCFDPLAFSELFLGFCAVKITLLGLNSFEPMFSCCCFACFGFVCRLVEPVCASVLLSSSD